MKQLLTMIVFAIAIFAGFTARAANLNPVIIIKTETGVVQCRLRSYMTAGDSRLSAREFNNYAECKGSAAYTHFKDNETIIKKPNPPSKPKPVIKPVTTKLDKYIQIFKDKTGANLGKTKITIGLLQDKVGVCYPKTRQIVIDKNYWEGSASELDKELTVYHELGHCVLNRAHYNPLNLTVGGENKCPRSMMYFESYTDKDAYRCFHQNREYYWDELIGGSFSYEVMRDGPGSYNDRKILKYHLPNNRKRTKLIGAFSCTFERGNVVKLGTEAFSIPRIICTRDKVIFFKASRIYVQSYGSNIFLNFTAQVKNYEPVELYLHDTILNEKYIVRIYRISRDLR